ncbi:phage protein [Limnobaculum xujianqingii]|uniref:phage protein n=1 Tax=Limnobaculum xujianqingii TaxID=2738837 RepID=UPI00112D47FA|nr:phage protein [Limnobaculum xujianqingii]
MTARISGQSFDVNVGGLMINVKAISLDIADNTAVAQTRGVPDGYTNGDVTGEGEIELDSQNFTLLARLAAEAGSWRGIEPMDFQFYANTGREEMKVEAYGCKLVVSNLLAIDPKGADTLSHKIKYFVTDPNFVQINGIPYLSESDVRDLIG